MKTKASKLHPRNDNHVSLSRTDPMQSNATDWFKWSRASDKYTYILLVYVPSANTPSEIEIFIYFEFKRFHILLFNLFRRREARRQRTWKSRFDTKTKWISWIAPNYEKNGECRFCTAFGCSSSGMAAILEFPYIVNFVVALVPTIFAYLQAHAWTCAAQNRRGGNFGLLFLLLFWRIRRSSRWCEKRTAERLLIFNCTIRDMPLRLKKTVTAAVRINFAWREHVCRE